MSNEGPESAFWAGKKVLLTGHTGFKGSWLSLWLQQMGAEVTGFALAPPTDPSMFELAGVARGMHSVLGDVRDLAALKQLAQEQQPEIVFHLAAQSLVRVSYDDPLGTYATNVLGTANVLEAVRPSSSVRAVLVVTSDKCYENRESGRAYSEGDSLGGRDPYSSSKACAELVTAAYRESFLAGKGIAVASARAGNVIGGGDWAPDRLVPDAMRAFLAGKPLIVRNPASVRPWQHVLDPLAGYLMLAERLLTQPTAFSAPWNFGPDAEDERPVSWVADELIRLWGKNSRWEQDARTHPHEARLLNLDSTRARTRLDWAPRWDLAGALKRTVQWYSAFSSGSDLAAETAQTISAYSTTRRPAAAR